MKRKMAVSVLVIVISIWSVAYASDGTGPRGWGCGDRPSPCELLAQLPADKEMLFHQTMREARGKASAMRAQVKEYRKEIKEILTADQFKEDLFREKMNSLKTLHSKMRATREEAIVKLAKEFTAKERQILAELMPLIGGHHRCCAKH
jgi:uncharacterized membrane protein